MLALMDVRDEQRGWLAKVIEATGIAPTTLAQRAGLAPTTLTRFLNSPEHASALSGRTISAVEKLTGIRYGAWPELRPALLREDDAAPYEAGGAGSFPAHVARMLEGGAKKPGR